MVIKQIINTVVRGGKPKITIKPSSVPKPEIAIKGVPKPQITIKSNNTTTLTGADILAEQNKAMLVTPKSVSIRSVDNPRIYQTEAELERIATSQSNKPRASIGEVAIRNPFHNLLKDCTPQNAEKASKLFKDNTGLELHFAARDNLVICNQTGYGGFDGALETLMDWSNHGLLNDLKQKGIKHVFIGHGTGSSVNGTWRIAGTNQSVPSLIDNTLKKGERALVLCCEQTPHPIMRNTPTIGREVDLTLVSLKEPAKVVEAGKKGIIGHFYNPEKIGGGLTLYPENVVQELYKNLM